MDKIDTYLNKLMDFVGQKPTIPSMMLNTAIAILAAYIIWIIFRRIINVAEKRAGAIKRIEINSSLFKYIRKSGGLLIIFVTGYFLIKVFHIQIIEKAYYALFILLWASPVKSFLLITLEYMEQNLASKTETTMDDIIFDLLNKFSGALVYAVAVVLALDILGINVMPFVAGAGVMGVAVGFAAKDTLSNLIAGILLIIDRPFEINDRIEVWSAPAGSASWGDVIEIGLRATKIKTTDNIVIIIPNNEIMKRDIVNYTILSKIIRVRINIGISYEADTEKAKQLIIEVAESMDWVVKDPKPKVVVRNFGESSVDLQLRVWIKDAVRRMDTISYVTDHIKTVFDRSNIEIPYPKREITIKPDQGS